MKRVNLKEAKGITLVALVITVIILLILAEVALSLVIGENGLIAKSKTAVEEYKDKSTDEKWQLEDLEAGIEEISLDELEDEEKHPELKTMKLVLNITEDNKTIQLPVDKEEDYEYNCEVYWGDGNQDTINNSNLDNAVHTYTDIGTYTIEINGIYEKLDNNNNNSIQQALVEVKQWGMTYLEMINLSESSNLKKIAIPSKNSFINVTCFYFIRCSNLIDIPEKLFANCPNVTSFNTTFAECTSLSNIPEKLFANCPNVTSFYCTFNRCTGLISIPKELFANCPNVTSFDYTFTNCINLTGDPIKLWNETKRKEKGIDETHGGCSCYAGCTKLTEYEKIPENWRNYIY